MERFHRIDFLFTRIVLEKNSGPFFLFRTDFLTFQFIFLKVWIEFTLFFPSATKG